MPYIAKPPPPQGFPENGIEVVRMTCSLYKVTLQPETKSSTYGIPESWVLGIRSQRPCLHSSPRVGRLDERPGNCCSRIDWTSGP